MAAAFYGASANGHPSLFYVCMDPNLPFAVRELNEYVNALHRNLPLPVRFFFALVASFNFVDSFLARSISSV